MRVRRPQLSSATDSSARSSPSRDGLHYKVCLLAIAVQVLGLAYLAVLHEITRPILS